jgi:hypothetical protein
LAEREEAAPGKGTWEAPGAVPVGAVPVGAEGEAVGATAVPLPALYEGAMVGWLATMVEVEFTGAPVGEELAVMVLMRVIVEVM